MYGDPQRVEDVKGTGLRVPRLEPVGPLTISLLSGPTMCGLSRNIGLAPSRTVMTNISDTRGIAVIVSWRDI